MRMTPAHFTWENTTISPGLARLTFKFTVKMKPRRILHEKTQQFLRGWWEWHLNVQSSWRPGAFYMRKHNDFSGVGGSGIWIYSQDEDQAHFTWENTAISPGLAGVAFKFTVDMKPKRILHEKTQRFLRVWRACARTFHVNFKSKWSLGAFYMRFLRGRRDAHVHFNLQSKWRPGAFTWENKAISSRLAGRARTLHVNLQSKWRQAHFTWEKTTISAGLVADWGGGVF